MQIEEETLESVDDAVTTDETNEPESLLDAVEQTVGDQEEPQEEADADPGEEDPDEAAEEEGEQEEADPAADADAASEEDSGADDQVDDEQLVASLSERAQERFKQLSSQVKELNESKAALEENQNQLAGWMNEVKASPQQFADAMGFMGMVNSGDPAKLRQAMQIAQQQVRDIAQQLGEAPEELNVFDGHDDLRDKVENMELSQQDALQLLQARRQQQQQAQQNQAYAQQQQQQAVQHQQQQAITDAAKEVGDLEQHWADTDPDWQFKAPILKGMMQTVAHLPADKWKDEVTRLYQSIPKPNKPAATRSNAPLPSSSASGGGASAPKNMYDAMWT